MQTGNGKIANLPNEIREELNYRLNDGEPGNELVAWLNAKPEVIEVINQLFDGRPISEQNLSHWRNHGYRVWHAHRTIVDETHALSGNSEVIAGTGINCEKLLLALTASYAEMIQRWIITPGVEMLCKLRIFKEITNAVLALRRAEIQKARLEIQRERLELLREKQRHNSAASSSGRASTSVDASLDGPASSSPAHAPTPEPHRPVTASPPPADKADAPQAARPAASGSLPEPEESPTTEESLPLPPSHLPVQPPSLPCDAPSPARKGPSNASPRNPFGLL